MAEQTRAVVFPRFLAESLALLEREAPEHLAAMRAHLGALAVTIDLRGAPEVRVCFTDPFPWVSVGAQGSIRVALGAATLDRFLLGALGIEEAVESGQLFVRGPFEAVLRLLDGFHAWLHGALRAPSMPALRRRFLGAPPDPIKPKEFAHAQAHTPDQETAEP